MDKTDINAYYGKGADKQIAKRVWCDGVMIAILLACGIGLVCVLVSDVASHLNNIQRIMCIVTYAISFCYALWLVYDIVVASLTIKKIRSERVPVSFKLYSQTLYNRQHKSSLTCFIVAVLFCIIVSVALLVSFLAFDPSLYILFYFTPAILFILVPINFGVNIISNNVDFVVDEVQFIKEQNEALNVRKITSNILDSNSYLIKDNKNCILVDAGATVDSLENFTTKIDAVLLTHCHYDHIYHLEQIVNRFKVKRVYIAEKGIKKLSDSALNVADTSKMDFTITAQLPLTPLNEDCTFKIGNIEVAAMMTPGHSNCGISYLIGGSLYSGDTLFRRGVGRYDLVTADKSKLVSSLTKLQAVDFVTLYPGHGDASNYEEQRRNIETWIKFLSRK